MLTVLGGLAEFERELIRTRTGEGRKRAKDRGHIDDAVPAHPLAAQPLGSVRDARLTLRLSRRLRPLGGCRCFNALQVWGQGRVLHVFLSRALGLDRR